MPEEMQNNPDSVKMVRAGDQALWFGRGMTGYGDWHLGIYGYKRNPLEFYRTMEVTQEEEVEKLEQLRWLKAGWDIGCSCVDFDGIEINTPEDVEKWNKLNGNTRRR
jgi:CMP-2-keto-3-deoxyoctulosonic acid synthetase